MRQIILGSLLVFSLLFLWQTRILAADEKDIIQLNDKTETVDIYEYSLLLSDKEGELTIDDIISKEQDHLFIPPASFETKPGFFPVTKWLKVQVENHALESEWILEFAFPLIYEINVYEEKGTNVEKIIEAGALRPFKEREINYRHFAFNLDIDTNERKTYYIQVRGGGDLHPPLHIWNKDTFLERIPNEHLFQGLFYGMIMVMIIYNLFIYFSLRIRAYLFYVISISFTLVAYMALNGDGFKFLWPNFPGWNIVSVSTLVSLSCIFIIFFTRDFLDTKRHVPGFTVISKVLIVLNCLTITFLFFNLYLALNMMFFTTFASFTGIISVGFLSLIRGVREARFFVIGWLVFLGGTFITILERAVILPYSIVTEYAGQATMVIEVLLLSFALADKISIIRKEKAIAEQAAREIQEMALESLRRTDKLKDEFLAITSHELRTPLYGMIGIAESIRDGISGRVPRDVAKQLDMIIVSGNRLSNLVNDILDFSKLRHDTMTIQLKSVRIADIVKIVFAVCKPLLKDKEIQLIKRVEDDLPAVIADPNRLQQIMYNLVGNAIKYTDKGEVVVTASLIDGDSIAIIVSDTGRGISKEEQEIIFEPFQQGNIQQDGQTASAGIGLGVAKHLVDLHGSDLTVESEVGIGSIFMFQLPIDKQGQYEETEIEPRFTMEKQEEIILMEPKALTEGQNVKVLIVDDELVNLQVLMNHLTLEEMEVVTTTNSEEVFALVEKHAFDLLILDIMMPNLSGYEVCEQLRETYSLLDLPILMLTAKDRVEDKLLAFSVGANDYVMTPCDKEELLSRVETLIRLKKMNDELRGLNAALEQKVLERTEELELVNIDLQETNDNLLKMAASRRNLLANIAHELGTPVMLLHSYMQALEAGILSEKDERKYRQSVDQNIKVLNRLIDDLADLSHLEEGSTSLTFQTVQVADWLDKVYERFVIDVSSFGRQLSSQPPTFSTSAYQSTIDVERMNQVFANILSNAVKHTSATNGMITLSTYLDESEAMMVLEIADNGIGIASDQLPYLFDRFYQPKPVDASKERAGSGIGLTIVKEIVEGHGGKVWATSLVGEGSSFYIALPIELI